MDERGLLPHRTLLRLRGLLNEKTSRGLVAVFTRRGQEETAWFYLDKEAIPTAELPPLARAFSLSELEGWLAREFERYDGLVASWLPIDVAYPDIPTKGANFYALEQEYKRRGWGAEQRRIWARLASHFLERMDPTDERYQAKIVQLITPSLLERVPREGLVGVLPLRGVNAYVREILALRRGEALSEEGPLARLVYIHLPDRFPPDMAPFVELVVHNDMPPIPEKAYAILFEELHDLCPEPNSPRILGLRPLLYNADLADALPQTLDAFIRYYAGQWRARGKVEDVQRLADVWLERRLREMDGNDLVGVIPVEDPSDTGFTKVYYVYRRLPEQRRKDSEMVALEPRENALPTPRHLWLALPPLRYFLPGTRWQDLGPAFYRAGRSRTLARNAWLLVQEMSGWEVPARGEWGGPERPEDLDRVELNTMVHSCALLSLENPWDWRQGRYFPMLRQAYETLLDIVERLARQMEEPWSLYYRALGAWYHCALATSPGEIQESIETMEHTLIQFQRLCRDTCQEDSKDRREMEEQAQHLYNLSRAILSLLRGGGQPDVLQQVYREELKPTIGSVPRTMRDMANMDEEVEIPTRLFRQAFKRYAQILISTQNIQRASIPVDDKIRQLEAKVSELRRAQRSAYALYHETRVLKELYAQSIRQTESVIQELTQGAHLTLQLLTRSAPHHEETHLTFEMRNIGRVEARNITVELVLSENFRLLDESAIQHIEAVPPDDPKPIVFRISPETDEDMNIRINVTYSTSKAPERPVIHSWDFPLQVVSLNQRPFTLKANPYIYGVPLQEPRLFYGRREELLSILNHLAHRAPQNILVRGARRSGKTSLLYMIKAVLEDRDRSRGARDRFDIPREWDASLNGIHPLFFSLQSLERLGDRLTSSDFFKLIIGRLADRGLALPNVEVFLQSPTLTVQQFERYVTRLLAEDPHLHLVFLVDEFDVLDLVEDKALYAHLRHIISSVQQITWIIASALGLYREVSDYESPLFNVFKIVDLGPLDRDSARRLILDPWQVEPSRPGASLQIVDDAVDAILRETGCYPYFIQLVCSEVVGYVNRKRTNYVLRKTVYEVIDGITTPRSPLSEHFAYLWDRVDGLSKLILLTLLREASPPSEGELIQAVRWWLQSEGLHFPRVEEELEAHLQRLEAMEAIVRDRYGRLRFGIPLFRRLLRKRSEREDLENVIRSDLGVES